MEEVVPKDWSLRGEIPDMKSCGCVLRYSEKLSERSGGEEQRRSLKGHDHRHWEDMQKTSVPT